MNCICIFSLISVQLLAVFGAGRKHTSYGTRPGLPAAAATGSGIAHCDGTAEAKGSVGSGTDLDQESHLDIDVRVADCLG